MKKCSVCAKTLELDCFAVNKKGKDGRHARCRKCSSEYDKKYNAANKVKRLEYKKKYRTENREKIAEYNAARKEKQKEYYVQNYEKLKNYRKKYHAENIERFKGVQENDINKRIKNLFNARKTHASSKGIAFTVTLKEIYEILTRQDNKCALTGMEFNLKFAKTTRRNAFGVSIDRIIPEKGYVKNNVQLVCNMVNMAKSDFEIVVFDAMCLARAERLKNGS